MKVRATAVGFHGGSRRRPGDTFDVPEGTKGSWFEPASKPAKASQKAEPEPRTLAEGGKLFGQVVPEGAGTGSDDDLA